MARSSLARTALAAASVLGSTLRERARRRLVLGTFVIELPSVATVRAMALAGFDFVVIDMEHSTFGFERLPSLIGAAHAAALPVLVRIWGEDVGLIGKALEAGANGVMVPHVDSVARARDVVMQTRFPPTGRRSFSPLTTYDAIGQSKPDLSAGTVVIVQIEGREGLAAAAEIGATEGIDGVFIGSHDLSGAMGVPVDDPLLIQVAQELAARLPDTVLRGVYLDRPDDCRTWSDLGFTLQCLSFDGRMLAEAAHQMVVTALAPAQEKTTQEKTT